MYQMKYSPVIGCKSRTLCDPSLNQQVMRIYQPITGLYFIWYIRGIFAKRQCKLQPDSHVCG